MRVYSPATTTGAMLKPDAVHLMVSMAHIVFRQLIMVQVHAPPMLSYTVCITLPELSEVCCVGVVRGCGRRG